MPEPYEAISTQDKEQWTSQQNGKTFQSYVLTAKNQAGETVPIEINRALTSPPPSPGETIWLETWETEFGLKGRKKQAPRQQNVSYTQDEGGNRDRSIVRQHSQHMALLALAQAGIEHPSPGDMLKTVEAWTDHFDADVQRASGTAQEARPTTSPSAPESPQASNGEATLTPKQQKWASDIATQHNLSDDDKQRILKKFRAEKLADVRMSDFDVFRQALVDPVPTGESDVPDGFEGASTGDDDSEIPF